MSPLDHCHGLLARLFTCTLDSYTVFSIKKTEKFLCCSIPSHSFPLHSGEKQILCSLKSLTVHLSPPLLSFLLLPSSFSMLQSHGSCCHSWNTPNHAPVSGTLYPYDFSPTAIIKVFAQKSSCKTLRISPKLQMYPEQLSPHYLDPSPCFSLHSPHCLLVC